MTKIINFVGGPGSGKSTQAAGLFYELKMRGRNVELALEYAKDLTWEERVQALTNQPYIFGKQYQRLHRLLGKVEAIITDSPIILAHWYTKDYPMSFKQAIVDIFNSMDNINYYVERVKKYDHNGRSQTEDEAKKIDMDLRELLDSSNIAYTTISGNREGLCALVDNVLSLL